ncbi:hypothetical protein [Oryza sativa Japonica Group]|uniref:Uncharacterized protein n=1 Tax=Oryza sativa subsp. japonica TaxID=39947 RepID=Q5QMB3_ORYSJ|nr:hypothetical protein [Oryza sativa Japonica Group]BAD87091.1 hypothetical protein [Oryza sativa Japonica Group]
MFAAHCTCFDDWRSVGAATVPARIYSVLATTLPTALRYTPQCLAYKIRIVSVKSCALAERSWRSACSTSGVVASSTDNVNEWMT